MYRINDKAAAIRAIQTYLKALNYNSSVIPNGVYDDNTRLAILDFQSKNNIAKTGVVDQTTFNLLYAEYVYKLRKQRIRKESGTFTSFPLREGETGQAILHLNEALAVLLDYYGITHRLRRSSFYSKETSAAVNKLQKIYMLPDSNFVDEELYIIMMTDLNSLKG